ncbi:MAG: hypothetical protein BGO12_13725 [Verrucomicrobia bacterium 61-8]|nr:hypothetical protein [Verrucomicrobiota bacterium]OJV10114.1 MAG: hypothetical protein BGO12_13725 [Verrucomicrobia bacterium 61-8]
MKYLISLLVLSLCAGCATRKETKSKPVVVVPGTNVSAKRLPTVRTPELVKAYPVGRYSDPNYPDEMHERHTVYRREQSPDWNYLPDPPVALPLGPTVAVSNTTPSYYAKAEGELNAQQRAYAEALQEQNRAMKKRIETLQQEAGKVQGLEKEIDRLKKQIDETPEAPAAAPIQPSPAKTEETDVFSNVEPELPAWEEGVSDPGEITLFAESDNQSQDYLLSQMRLNDEFAAELAAAERRKISVVLNGPFLRRKELALLNH